jgi:hypothetical protein
LPRLLAILLAEVPGADSVESMDEVTVAKFVCISVEIDVADVDKLIAL